MEASSWGAVFLKAIDRSGEYKDKHYVANLILTIIIDFGAQNVVQIITDNALLCKIVDSFVEAMHPHLFWTPCVVHMLSMTVKKYMCTQKYTRQ